MCKAYVRLLLWTSPAARSLLNIGRGEDDDDDMRLVRLRYPRTDSAVFVFRLLGRSEQIPRHCPSLDSRCYYRKLKLEAIWRMSGCDFWRSHIELRRSLAFGMCSKSTTVRSTVWARRMSCLQIRRDNKPGVGKKVMPAARLSAQ